MKNIGFFSFLDEEIKQINTSQNYLNDFKKIYSNKIGEEGTDKIISNAISIFSKCITKDTILVNKTGIVLGKIQAGKTSNFLGLIAMGLDNNIDIVILIGGRDKKLLTQNEIRLKEVFNSNDSNKVIIEDINYFFAKDFKYFFNYLGITKKHKLIITCLKNPHHLENLGKFLKNSNLASKNIMIIDDEGDQATLNNNAERKNKEATTLYKKITNIIKNILKHYVYIQITATPYANLFLRDSDILKPKFLQLTHPGNSYMGLSDFHGENSNQFIRIIDKNEINIDNWEINPVNSKSFLWALSTFLISSCLKMAEERTIDSESTMLIHTNIKKDIHKITSFSLRRLIDDLKNKSKLDKTNIQYGTYLKFCNYGFSELFGRNLDYFNNTTDQDIINKLEYIFQNLDIVELNGNNIERNREKPSYAKHVILIGAKLVERGITFPNLLVTYITRRSKNITNADTVHQRARWFGYRKEIKNYMRIFCLEEIQDDYEEILAMEEDLWFNLEDLNNNDALLSEYVKTLNLNKAKLRPTRLGVVDWRLEKIMLWQAQKEIKTNQEIEYNLYDELLKKGTIEEYDTIKHKSIIYPNIKTFEKEFSNILENILSYCNINLDFWNYWKLKEINTKVKVLIMNPNSNSEDKRRYRTLLKDGKIQIFRGRSEKEITENRYKGDRNLNEYFQNQNLILVEIYKFDIHSKKKNNTEKINIIKKDAIFYAFYFPGEGVVRYVAKQN